MSNNKPKPAQEKVTIKLPTDNVRGSVPKMENPPAPPKPKINR